MERPRFIAKSVKLPQSGIISLPGAWGPKVVMGKGADAIVSRTGSHYVVSIIPKPTTPEQKLSAMFMHLIEFTKELWCTTMNDAEKKPDVQKEENKDGTEAHEEE